MTKAAELAKMGEIITNDQIGGRRNVIINGSQQVAQRATSVADVGGSQGYFCTDRFKSTLSGTAARYTVSQDSDAPAGFSKALKYDVTTADTSVAAAEFHAISYRAEGQDISHFEWGTSDAKKCTFSFYAKATTAQTVVVNFVRATSGTSRSVSKAFSITTSYQRFTFTLPADTGGSAQVETNAEGLAIHIGFGGGSNFTGGTINETWEDITNNKRFAGVGNLASSTDNNFFITGIQLEVGSQATPFEHRSFGEELLLCQRYFQLISGGAVMPNSSTGIEGSVTRQEMRAATSISVTAAMKVEDPSVTTYTQSSASATISNSDKFAEKFTLQNFSGLNTQRPYFLKNPQDGGGQIELDAEL
jgi:hypothetical protein